MIKSVSVQCRSLRLAYGSTEVLEGVSLDIAPGTWRRWARPAAVEMRATLCALIHAH